MPLAFTPISLGPLRLRNRILKPATFEGMCPEGRVTDALVEHHRAVAAGGAALTTVAYASISPDGRSYATQLLVDPGAAPGLRHLADAVHAEGAAVALQVGHCGYFANPRVIGGPPLGASRRFNTYGLAFARPATEEDLARVIRDFAAAARIARDAGIDAVELHLGHGYLVSQFLSPFTNRRRDRWGGSLENRARLAVEVVRAARAATGPDYPILAKVNLFDGFPGGLTLPESIAVARLLEAEGATALVLSCGFVSRTPLLMLRGEVPVRRMAAAQERWHARLGLTLFGHLLVRPTPFTEGFLLEDALRMRAAVRLPLVLLGGLRSLATIERALAGGIDMVGLGRALLHDPGLPRRMERGETGASTCFPCNECIAEMDRGGVRCTRPGS
ncbi:MAG TPA: NADH:flavin oxidoreductase [Anaeromyxobacteraceae bacterium]|nr:NADH:flavin oxidoreductase [Anaeromyxobacteraceae bacterium]